MRSESKLHLLTFAKKKKIKIPFSVDSNGEFQVQLDLLGFFFTTSYTPSLYFKTQISLMLLVNVKFDSRLLIFWSKTYMYNTMNNYFSFMKFEFGETNENFEW